MTVWFVSTCDYCSAILPDEDGAALACGSCQARVDAAAAALHAEYAAEEADAALDAAEFNDPAEQERLQHEADLAYEYSGPEYDEGPETWDQEDW